MLERAPARLVGGLLLLLAAGGKRGPPVAIDVVESLFRQLFCRAGGVTTGREREK